MLIKILIIQGLLAWHDLLKDAIFSQCKTEISFVSTGDVESYELHIVLKIINIESFISVYLNLGNFKLCRHQLPEFKVAKIQKCHFM